MDQTDEHLWSSFEALAKTYPRDSGVRLTADLARWLLEERQRRHLPIPPKLDEVSRSVSQILETADKPDPI